MSQIVRTCLLAVLWVAGSSGSGAATAPVDDIAMHSYLEAREVLKRALDAAGGVERIRAIRSVSLRYDGVRHMINQSRKPLGPWDREPSYGRLLVDRVGDRMFAESYTTYPGIGAFGAAWALNGAKGVHWEPTRHHHGPEIIANLSGSETDGPWAFIPRWMPPLMLLAAWEAGTDVRSLGSFDRDGRRIHAVAFTQRDRSTVALAFDAATGMYYGFQSIRSDGVFGDVTDSVEYSDFRPIGGVLFPARRRDRFNGEISRELDLHYTVDAELTDGLFEIPPGYSQPSAETESARLRKIGDGVYLDTHMGGVMIVEFDDFLAVVECPGDYWMSASTIEAAAQAFPGKPIRFVIPSHTHGDHGGGARAYFEIGATLLTTPGHADFYRKLAALKQVIAPDPYESSGRAAVIETFAGKRIISDGRRTMELYDVGPNAHSDELTVVSLPEQRILWQADLFFSPMTGGGINPAMPITVEFARKLKSLGVTGFEQIVESHHSRVVTGEDFRRSLALAGVEDY